MDFCFRDGCTNIVEGRDVLCQFHWNQLTSPPREIERAIAAIDPPRPLALRPCAVPDCKSVGAALRHPSGREFCNSHGVADLEPYRITAGFYSAIVLPGERAPWITGADDRLQPYVMPATYPGKPLLVFPKRAMREKAGT